jgi:hypothetical protein
MFLIESDRKAILYTGDIRGMSFTLITAMLLTWLQLKLGGWTTSHGIRSSCLTPLD